MKVIIYFDEQKKSKQVISPVEGKDKFDGNVFALVEAVTKSNNRHGLKRYHHFEIV